jgi:hypothetical protein
MQHLGGSVIVVGVLTLAASRHRAAEASTRRAAAPTTATGAELFMDGGFAQVQVANGGKRRHQKDLILGACHDVAAISCFGRTWFERRSALLAAALKTCRL